MLRVYDLARPDAEPIKFAAATSAIRNAAWLSTDQLIITALADTAGIA